MSGVNLHEFNNLSKRHNYFMTNNRKNGFPTMTNNSSFLQKIIENKARNSNHKMIYFGNNKPKKYVTFIKEEDMPYRNNYQSPLIDKRNFNTSSDNYYGQRNNKNIEALNREYYTVNNKKKIIPYNKEQNDNINNDLYESKYCRVPIKLQNGASNNSDIYNQHSNLYSVSNINESEGEKGVLNFKGKKYFNLNSFSASKNDTTLNSPEKNMNKSRAESELFRNHRELKKKKEEIYQRKINRESSVVKRNILRKEKDKEIKKEKVDIDINTINNVIKNKFNNTMKEQNPINKNKNQIINMNNNNEINNNMIRINDRFKSIDIYLNNNSIKAINKNPNSINTNNIPTTIKRIYKYRVNKLKLNKLTNNNYIVKKKNDKDINTINKNNIKFPSEVNNKFFNNVYITQSTDYSPQKKMYNMYINNKIKENINEIRKSKKSLLENDSNKTFNNNLADKYNNSYKFIIPRKRFIEDYTHEAPIIYSNDKKVSIRMHTLLNLNETFLGKHPTKEKLKFQRVINIFFDKNSKVNQNTFKNKRKHKILSSIKEEKEKSKAEPISKYIKSESKLERNEKPVFQRNIRMKYLCRNKK